MDRDKLFRYLEQRYSSKRDMITRIPLGVQPDALWQELLNLRRSRSTALPLYSCNGTPYWYVTTDKMVAASEKVVDALFENETEYDPYTDTPPVSTLEEVFFTSYVEGAQITMQAAMDFLTRDLPPRDMEEQLIANNRMAGSFASGNLYRGIDMDYLRELAYVLTDGMDNGGQDFRSTDEVDFVSGDGETFEFPSPRVIPDRVNELCGFLAAQKVHPLIKAAVAQAYILIIRPFTEGNERLGRLLSSVILIRSGYTFFGDVSLSALIARKSYAYYEATVNILREENGGDLTYFVEFFLELLSRAVDERRLRMQRRDEQTLQAEQELARTALIPPTAQPPAEPALKAEEDGEPPGLTRPNPDGKGGELLEGYVPVAPAENEPWETAVLSEDETDIRLGRVRDTLHALSESEGALMKKAAILLLGFMDNGVMGFTVGDLESSLGLTPKQAGNLITHLKTRGLIESTDEKSNRLKLYRFGTGLAPLRPKDYAAEVIDAVKTLRFSSKSPKDKRIGEIVSSCMPKGIITADDYGAIREGTKMSSDMLVAERMGIVTKVCYGAYRINRELTLRPAAISNAQKLVLTELYKQFRNEPFSRIDAMEALNHSKSTVCSHLHQFVLLKIVECEEAEIYAYRLVVNPAGNPELFLDIGDAEDGHSENGVQESAEETVTKPEPEPGDYGQDVYDLLETLAASSTSHKTGVLRTLCAAALIRERSFKATMTPGATRRICGWRIRPLPDSWG